MTKIEFLNALSSALDDLSDEDIKSSVEYYSEMIDDRTEGGMSEQEAVAEMGSVAEAAQNIMLDMPLGKIIKSRYRRKRVLKTGEIVLLILGAPIWLSLLLACAACALAVYIVLWAVIIAFWSVVAAFSGAAVGLIVAAVVAFAEYGIWSALANFGGAILLFGLACLACYGCVKLTALFVKLSIKFTKFIKWLIIGRRKENEEIN